MDEDLEPIAVKTAQFSKRGKDASLEAISILPPQRLAQNRLVLHSLNICLTKLKLCIMLPKIFENPITVCRALNGTPYEICAKKLIEYLRTRQKDIKITVGGPQCFDDNLIALINLFFDNYECLDVLPNWVNNTAISDHYIIEAFDLLTHIVDQRMHRNAYIELQKEKEMHYFYQENLILRKEIETMKKRLRSQKQQQRWKRASRSGTMFKYQEELIAKKWQHVSSVNQAISENVQRLKILNFGLGHKINQLEEEASQLEAQFLKSKIVDAKQLKSVREEKNKYLIQLENTIEKHDRILGEKIKENVYLQDEYDKQQEEMNNFMVGYLALEKEFNDIIMGELAERERIWKLKADKFFYTRAARIIQRHFRKYLVANNLLQKGKKGKGKGKGKKGKK